MTVSMNRFYAVHRDSAGTVSLAMEYGAADIVDARAHLEAHLASNPSKVKPGEYLVLTTSEYKGIVWRQEWDALTAIEQDLLKTLWPRLAGEFDPGTTKLPSLLRIVARHRLHSLGLSEPCARCGGSGRHSRNERFGTTCFKCGEGSRKGTPGTGYQMPRINQDLIARVAERMTRAILDETGKITGLREV